MILSSGFPNFTLSAVEHRFHRGTDVPKNGAAQLPAPFTTFCDRDAETTSSMSTGDCALTFRDGDRWAGVLFWRGDRGLGR